MKVTSTQRIWSNDKQTLLCKDGDPKSAFLVAVPGLDLDSSELAKFENAPDFFPELAAQAEGGTAKAVKQAATDENEKDVQPKSKGPMKTSDIKKQ